MKKFIISLLIMLLLPVRAFAEQINVAFTIDNKYVIPTMLVINSILKNNDSNSDYVFYIIENNLLEENKSKIANYVKGNNQKIEFIHFSNDLFQTASLSLKEHFSSPITMIRALMPNLVPASVDRIIYLDADILVNSDLISLYNTDLKGNYVGMAYDISTKNDTFTDSCGFFYKYEYFNSGVILMDLTKWREDKIADKMIAFVENNQNKFRKEGRKEGRKEETATSCTYAFPDQDLINNVLHTRITAIDSNWNQQLPFIENAYIYHYLGRKKPWKFCHTKTFGYRLYYKYWNSSPFKNYQNYYKILSIRTNYLKTIKNLLKHYSSTGV